jgi:alkanesulfonate monooxygenase SsuD/methylene tetrahydromethanopterin reductase-like flavin-dependent oxidoreductase (luciferase family)
MRLPTSDNQMRVYQFSEQPYPDAWKDHGGSLRVNLPNRRCDPAVAADLFHRYYDEWLLAEELGLDIMLNEHHQTATCMSSTVIVGLSVLARQLATVDVISRGRLDMGFIKGVPYEFAPSNQNPVGVMDRFWEAHDFIIKALTSHDAPFNWESEHFHYRQVNIWPRPWQQPHPPVWSTTGSKSNARVLGERGYVMATLGTGYNTRALYDAYREGYMSKGRPAPAADRFAYLGLVAVAANEREARERGERVASYLRAAAIVHVPFRNPPGFLSAEDNARLMRGQTPPRSYTRDRRVINMNSASVAELIDAGILFCGTPDQVYAQIVDFCEYCGGMGNLLMMGHAGAMSHADTVENLTLFAKEVYPRLKEYKQPVAKATAA